MNKKIEKTEKKVNVKTPEPIKKESSFKKKEEDKKKYNIWNSLYLFNF